MKRFLMIALISVGLLLSQTTSARAEIPEVTQHQQAVEASLQNGSVNLESQSSTTFKQGSAVPIVLGILGGEPTQITDSFGNKKITYSIGLVGDMGTAIAWLYKEPAADPRLYVADVMKSAGFAEPAYAQGIGFSSLTPILDTWKKFRNIAYFFFVIIFLAIGFMIMLRQRIGGQTAVTAQQAIPRVIVSLLFVTFSYAIAGLLIDLMYLVMFLMLGLFGKQTGQFIGMNFLSLGFTMITSGARSAYDVVNAFTSQATDNLVGFGGELTGFMTGLTMAVVIAIAIGLNVFRLFFELLKTYVVIVLSIVFSPVLLMMGALPNSKDVFMGWIKNLIGNLSAFPAVLLVLIVFDELTNSISGGATSKIENGGFLPPYLFGRAAGNGAASALTFGVGLGMLLIMPEIVKKVKETMGAKGGIFEQFAGNLGESLKRGWTGGQIIPGLGFTDTSKWAGGGLSGKNFVQKGAEGISGVGSGLFSTAQAPSISSFSSGFTRGAARTAMGFKDESTLPVMQEFLKKQDEETKKKRLAAKTASPAG